MQRVFKFPFIFLVVAGGIGLLLRWYFVSPMSWVTYPNWLHGHSHTMFLGWIFNLVMLAYLYNYSLWDKMRYRALFAINQALIAGMLVSFPMQGYGAVSIVLSVLHTVSAWIFSCWFFKDLRNHAPSMAAWCARISLFLFALASLGPFALGPLMASGLGHSKWYYFTIYYYLHFQYNGVFSFALLSLWFHTLQTKNIQVDQQRSYRAGWLLLVSLFPSYFLSVLWAKPGLSYNGIGFAGAVLQLLALFYAGKTFSVDGLGLKPQARVLWIFAAVCLVIKSLLQLLSAHPAIAQLALQTRPFVMAYLHLVLIGTVSFFLIGWCIENSIIVLRSWCGIILLFLGFIGTELVMISSGLYNSVGTPFYLFLFSAVLLLSFGIIMIRMLVSSAPSR